MYYERCSKYWLRLKSCLSWTCRELNPVPHPCEGCVLPMNYRPYVMILKGCILSLKFFEVKFKNNSSILDVMPYFSYDLKIPKERVAVLIGKDGHVKKEIEAATKTKLRIDSEEGDIFVEGEDAVNLYTTKDIIRAIGRGFNPEIALLLLRQDYTFDLLMLEEYAKNKNQVPRLKGRVIGSEGKTRRLIEELTETHLSVYGKTIGVIGYVENVGIARRAIESLLTGSMHSTVYRWLETKRRQIKLFKYGVDRFDIMGQEKGTAEKN